jgi:hypothetical protein
MKYGEDKIIKEIGKIHTINIWSTLQYNQRRFPGTRYVKPIRIDKDFCQANAIKYLCRYGKKDGKNRKDLLKAIHYIVLLMSSEDNK